MMSTTDDVKVFCIGSNLESYNCLKYLIEKNCAIHTLITLPSGYSKNVSDYYDLHEFCDIQGIQVIDTTNVNSLETVEQIKSVKPDYLFTLGWSQIFKEDLIGCFSKFVVGTHPSKLPHGRGRAPLVWTILENLKKSALSFFKIDTGIDTGNLIFQREFDIPPGSYVKDVYDTISRELGYGFHEIYKAIIKNQTLNLTKQSEENVTVRGKRTPSDGFIHFNKSNFENESLIRSDSEPYPGAYCYYKNEKITFWRVEFDIEKTHSGTIGQILKKRKEGILVQFLDGNLWLNKPTDSKGNNLDSKFFKLGDKLGFNIEDELYNLKQKLG